MLSASLFGGIILGCLVVALLGASLVSGMLSAGMILGSLVFELLGASLVASLVAGGTISVSLVGGMVSASLVGGTISASLVGGMVSASLLLGGMLSASAGGVFSSFTMSSVSLLRLYLLSFTLLLTTCNSATCLFRAMESFFKLVEACHSCSHVFLELQVISDWFHKLQTKYRRQRWRSLSYHKFTKIIKNT
jgi:hypothetical protein